MNNPRLRWAVLIVALGGAIGASVYPVEEPAAATPVRARATESAKSISTPAVLQQEAARANIDPFAARGWQATQAVPETSTVVAEVVVNSSADAPAAAPVAPPLPFHFVGRMNDGGNEVVYLRDGESIVLARQGEVLQGIYQVLELGAGEIQFLHVPTGEKQSMSLPAPDS